MVGTSSETGPQSAGPVVVWAERAAGASVIAAVILVPLVFSNQTPYALDVKWLYSGGCALLAGLALLVRWAAGGRLLPKTAAMARVLGLFLFAVVVSALLSEYHAVSLRETWWYAAHMILFLAAAVAFRRRGWGATFVAVILVTATFVGICGCLQAGGVDILGTSWSKGDRVIDFARGDRVLSTVGLETELGGYMAACAALALGVALFAGPVAVRIVSLGAALVMASCMVCSGTRTAWFAAGVGALVVIPHYVFTRLADDWRTRAGRAAVIVAAVVGLAWLGWFGPGMVRRVRLLREHLPTRTTIWRSALAMAWDSPVVGKGPGAFRIYFPEFRPVDYARHDVGSITLWAHSEYLEVLAETGALGMVAFAIFLGFFAMGNFRALTEVRAELRRALRVAAFGATAALLAHALASVATRWPTCRMMLWVTMGLTVALWDDSGPAEETARPSCGRAWRALLVLVAAAATWLVWTDQVRRPYLARKDIRLAQDFQKAGRWAESIASARRAIQRDPDSVPARYELGNSLFYAGRYEAALRAFDALLERSPHYHDVPLRIAVLHAMLGQMDEARAALRQARRYGVAWGGFTGPGPLRDDALRSLAAEFERGKRDR